jgi:hypothetical protein
LDTNNVLTVRENTYKYKNKRKREEEGRKEQREKERTGQTYKSRIYELSSFLPKRTQIPFLAPVSNYHST